MQGSQNHISEWQYRVAYERHEPSYKSLFLHFYKELTTFAYSFVKTKESAEEVVSDVMVKIWLMGKELSGIQNLRVYLFSATRNTALTYLKKEQRLASWEAENVAVELNLNLYHPEAAMLHSELQQKVAAAVRELPPKCQMVYKLIREDGFSYKETGTILEISENTVDRHLSKAVQRLREAVSVYLR
ncbi:MAG TPA: RNA polymerase sigma-70 factor [Chitinophagaceae bacterium]|jgi:RNA polymerase sigma-70 factor (ECF subfamily)|nr:RNA polymerase sigma-70 factor [Chitinophagaceae bacterium]